jgi:hypothetical protein
MRSAFLIFVFLSDPGLDKDDSMYYGKTSSNRVDQTAATYTSIIQTRRAKAAATVNVSRQSVEDPSQPNTFVLCHSQTTTSTDSLGQGV